MSISNIDDLLMGVGNSQQPATPEHKEKLEEEKEAADEIEKAAPEYDDTDESDSDTDEAEIETDESTDDTDETEEKPERKEEIDEDGLDEYGNKKERMSKGMKERLDRKEKQHQREIEQREHELQTLRQQLAQQGASPQVQKAAEDFKYDPNDDGSWQQQLTDFVKQTVQSMNTEQQETQKRHEEAQVQAEFETKFRDGMNRFDDFSDVITSLPFKISNPMTLATRSMENPASFLYAAAKRHPQELERISKIRDPYGQMMEMGKLEERMRRNKPTTKAPRPLSRNKEDVTAKTQPKQKDTTGDDLLANANAKRLAVVKTRHKANR